jgi:hypothetical protein
MRPVSRGFSPAGCPAIPLISYHDDRRQEISGGWVDFDVTTL